MKTLLRITHLLLVVASVAWAQDSEMGKVHNVAVVRYGVANGTVIATSSDGVLLLLQYSDEPDKSLGLPPDIVSIDDISISDEGFLFGLSVFTPVLCSFDVAIRSIIPIGCIDAVDFSLQDYTGLSCQSGTCVVSGGYGGYTVLYYDITTGVLSPTLECLNCKIDDGDDNDESTSRSSLVEVVLMDSRFAAFTVVRDSIFNSVVVDVGSGATVATHVIPDPVDNALAIAPTNFPCVTDVYRSKGSGDLLFTACGSITVQMARVSNTTTVVTPPVQNYTAVTLAIDSKRNILIVGGRNLDTAGSIIALYVISTRFPTSPFLATTLPIVETVVSVTIHDGILGFLTLESNQIFTVDIGYTQPPSSSPFEIPSPMPMEPPTNPLDTPPSGSMGASNMSLDMPSNATSSPIVLGTSSNTTSPASFFPSSSFPSIAPSRPSPSKRPKQQLSLAPMRSVLFSLLISTFVALHLAQLWC